MILDKKNDCEVKLIKKTIETGVTINDLLDGHTIDAVIQRLETMKLEFPPNLKFSIDIEYGYEGETELNLETYIERMETLDEAKSRINMIIINMEKEQIRLERNAAHKQAELTQFKRKNGVEINV